MEKSAAVSRRVRLDPDVLVRAVTDVLPARGHTDDGEHEHINVGDSDRIPPSPSPSLIPILHTARANTTIALTTGTSRITASGNGVAPPAARGAGAPTTVRFTLRMKTGRKKPARRPLTPTESVSDGYFSDSDDDEKRKRRSPVKGHRPTSTEFMLETCHKVYENSCKTLKIIPRQHFVKQLGNTEMNMRNEGLSRKELNAVCASLVSFEKLFSIDLSGNHMSERCIGYICQLLERNSFITKLSLTECDINVAGLAQLVPVIPRIAALQSLDISGNKLRDEAGELVSTLISTAQDLSKLSLSHNELRERGGIWIGEAIAKNEGLETLDLSWNHLRGKGAECVALALMKNKTLTHLDLSWNGFGFEGCCALGHALHNNTTLKELNLTCNRIHPPALYELLKGILCNRGLTCLRLAQNPIPAAMTSAILAKFRDAKDMALVTLDFSGIVVDKLFEVVLAEIQEQRPHFECLYDRSLPVHKARWEDLDRLHQESDEELDRLHKGVLNIDPMRILFFIKKNLRVIDLFRQMDTDHSATISRDEIRKALLKEQLPVSSASLDMIMDYLDVNGDGQIDLMGPGESLLAMYEKELVDGERRFKRETIAEKQEWKNRERLSIEQAQKDGLPADLGGTGARFSRSFRPDLIDLHGQSKEALGKKSSPKKGKGDFIKEDLKLPSINDRPGNITENSTGSVTDRSSMHGSTVTKDTLPSTVR